MRKSIIAAGLTLALVSSAAQAQTLTNPSCTSLGSANLVKNCSFESPDVPASGQQWQFTQTISDWSSSKGWFERWYGHDGFKSRDGGAHLELDVDRDQAGKVANTTIWQVLNTEVGQQYNVFFSAAHRKLDNSSFSQIGAFLDLTGSATPTFSTAAFTTPQIGNADKYKWFDYGFTFTATGSKTTLGFRALGTENEYGDHLDNIGVSAVTQPNIVPEPGSLALVSFGLVALGGVARRRRNA